MQWNTMLQNFYRYILLEWSHTFFIPKFVFNLCLLPMSRLSHQSLSFDGLVSIFIFIIFRLLFIRIKLLHNHVKFRNVLEYYVEKERKQIITFILTQMRVT